MGLSGASSNSSNRMGAARGVDAACCIAALPGSTAAASSRARATPGRVFLAARRRTILVHSAGLVSIAGGSASLGHTNRGGDTLLQRLGQGFSPPSGRPPRGPWPNLLVRGILDLQTWISLSVCLIQKTQTAGFVNRFGKTKWKKRNSIFVLNVGQSGLERLRGDRLFLTIKLN